MDCGVGLASCPRAHAFAFALLTGLLLIATAAGQVPMVDEVAARIDSFTSERSAAPPVTPYANLLGDPLTDSAARVSTPKGFQILVRNRSGATNYTLWKADLNPAKWNELAFFRIPDMTLQERLYLRLFERSNSREDISKLYFTADYICISNAHRLYYGEFGSRKVLEKEPVAPALLRVKSDPGARVKVLGARGIDSTPYERIIDLPFLTLMFSRTGYLERSEFLPLKPGLENEYAYTLLPEFPEDGDILRNLPDSLFKDAAGLDPVSADRRMSDLLNLKFLLLREKNAVVSRHARDDAMPVRVSQETKSSFAARLETWRENRRKEAARFDGPVDRCDSAIAHLARSIPDWSCRKDTLSLSTRVIPAPVTFSSGDGLKVSIPLDAAPFAADLDAWIQADEIQAARLQQAWATGVTIRAVFWRNAVFLQADTAWKIGFDTLLVSLGNTRFASRATMIPRPRLAGKPGYGKARKAEARLRAGCLEAPCRGFWSCHWGSTVLAGGLLGAAGTGWVLYPILSPPDPPPQKSNPYRIDITFQEAP